MAEVKDDYIEVTCNAESEIEAQNGKSKLENAMEKVAFAITNDPETSPTGLSELSKQLRVLQNINKSQGDEIDRLERRLKIISDLKGVSINDLRNALHSACESEAYSELQGQVRSLRTKLELAEMTKGLGGSKEESNFDKEASEQQIAFLQLRVGELEKAEDNHRKEIHNLYHSLNQQKSEVAKFESEHKQKQQECIQFDNKCQHQGAQITHLESEVKQKGVQLTHLESEVKQKGEHITQLESNVEQKGIQITNLERKLEQKGVEIDELRKRAIDNDKDRLIKESTVAKTALVPSLPADNSELIKAHAEALAAKQAEIDQQRVDIQQLAKKCVKIDELQKKVVDNDKERQIKESTMAKTALIPVPPTDNSELIKSHTKALATKQAEIDQQRVEIQRLKLEKKRVKINELRKRAVGTDKERDIKESTVVKTILVPAPPTDNSELIKSHAEALAAKQAEIDQQRAGIQQLVERINVAEWQVQVEKDMIKVLEDQVEAREKKVQLKTEQFESRSRVQEQKIFDLEQRFSSLHTAFEVYKEEHSEKEVAPSSPRKNVVTPSPQKTSFAASPGSPPTRSLSSPPSTPFNSSDVTSSPASYRSPFSDDEMVTICEGYLKKKDSNMLRGWKKRYFILYGCGHGNYKLTYSDDIGQAVKGTIEGIQTGVSIVARTKEFPKHPLTFVLRVNTRVSKGAVLDLEASNSQELKMWMVALASACGIELGAAGIGWKPSTSLSSSPTAAEGFPVGSCVVLVGLVRKPEYNGMSGIVKTALEEGRHRVSVLALDKSMSLRLSNLEYDPLVTGTDVPTTTHRGIR
mmetsp:Transcript_18510/g.27061  ORF Transcript_18510/g.27061 Transcript_18510/m.27061 type:complete len:810 (+) Transcript_18510:319-2748(+)|eukprot:CAMPEP_0195518920 /NCGR_PEP_ID=MMETSP0794_2-20130614/13947_1 /TAXON_ID=515487 /ORGANISM="Stephanopyxis turris, Strain CCMP 815" /LENGTH=809 /DNA_ID=CAMNT_0040647967 /DNA_START=319 /DNA_END=2748 /DNA_ORIENTATION=-